MKSQTKMILKMILVSFVTLTSFSLFVADKGNAATVSFSDDFEAETIDPFWTTVREWYGTVELSSDQSLSGSQSVRFSSTSGGDRGIYLSHNFNEIMKGSVSVWLYDTMAGQNGLYAILDVFNTTVPWGQLGYRFQVGVMDWNYYWYHAYDGVTNFQTSVPRTVGWHEFKIVYNSGDVQLFIDGTLVSSVTGDYGFDSVFVTVQGPYWRPNATFYFDDFNVQASPAWVVEVLIDIKPGSDPNSINLKSKGKIPVAILTTDTFDATTVDPLSVEFGLDGAMEAHGEGHIEDVDDDGDLDLVLHFNTQETGIACGDIEAGLTGETFDGQAIEGSDSINTVGCK